MIRGLLRTDPQNRFTVEQVINNPWIKVNTLDSIVHQYFEAVLTIPQQHKVHCEASLCPRPENMHSLTRVEDLTKQTGITCLSVHMAHVALEISLQETVIVKIGRQTVRFVRTLSER